MKKNRLKKIHLFLLSCAGAFCIALSPLKGLFKKKNQSTSAQIDNSNQTSSSTETSSQNTSSSKLSRKQQRELGQQEAQAATQANASQSTTDNQPEESTTNTSPTTDSANSSTNPQSSSNDNSSDADSDPASNCSASSSFSSPQSTGDSAPTPQQQQQAQQLKGISALLSQRIKIAKEILSATKKALPSQQIKSKINLLEQAIISLTNSINTDQGTLCQILSAIQALASSGDSSDQAWEDFQSATNAGMSIQFTYEMVLKPIAGVVKNATKYSADLKNVNDKLTKAMDNMRASKPKPNGDTTETAEGSDHVDIKPLLDDIPLAEKSHLTEDVKDLDIGSIFELPKDIGQKINTELENQQESLQQKENSFNSKENDPNIEGPQIEEIPNEMPNIEGGGIKPKGEGPGEDENGFEGE